MEEEKIIYRRHFGVFDESYSSSSDDDDDDDDDNNDGGDSSSSSASKASPEKKVASAPTTKHKDVSESGTNGKRLTSQPDRSYQAPSRAANEKPIQIAIYRQEASAHDKDGSERPTLVDVQYCELLKTRQRTSLAANLNPLETFHSDVDHYAALHPDATYGVKLLDIAKAFFPSKKLTTSLVDVNGEPTVSGIPVKFFQIVTTVANTLHISMDQVYPLLSSAYLPRAPTVDKNADWRSETHDTNRFDPAKRRFPKERVVPIYLIPHFFALHPALKNDAHNNAILFGHRLIREMERRVPIKYNNKCFMDALHQLYANFDKLAYHFQTNTEMLHILLSKMDNMALMHAEAMARYDQIQALVASVLNGPLKERLDAALATATTTRQPRSLPVRKRKREEEKAPENEREDDGGVIDLEPLEPIPEAIDDIMLDDISLDANEDEKEGEKISPDPDSEPEPEPEDDDEGREPALKKPRLDD